MASEGADCGTVCLHQVTRYFAGDPVIEVLAGVELVVHAGDLVTIVGRSGAGKSTMVNILGLVDTPSSGIVHVSGKSVGDLDDDQRAAIRGAQIGFVFQSFHLMDRRTVLGNVAISGAYHGIEPSVREERARLAIHQVGLEHRMHARAWTLSGGERQRVAIARALAGQPAVLVCDEPTGNLDPGAAEQVVALLENAADEGLAVVLITHDLPLAQRGSRQLELRGGVLLEQPA